jgi:hypothetical protein
LDQVAGCLSKLSTGKANGTTTSPVINLTVNITIHAPTANGGGASVTYRPSLWGKS